MKNNMKIGRREIMLLLALGFVIYMFIGINFVWIDFFTGYKSVNSEYVEAKNEYDILKNETKNIDLLKDDLNGIKQSSERLNQYIADNNSAIDAIIYLNKLSSLAPSGISNIIISSPEIINIGKEEKNSNSKNSETKNNGTYLKLDVEFATTMNYEKYRELVSYIEGSAKKVIISEIDIKPVSVKDEKNKDKILTENLNIKMKLQLYSLGLLESDYENAYNFNSFTEADGGILKIDNLEDIENLENVEETEDKENEEENTEVNEEKEDVKSGDNDPGITDIKNEEEKVDISSVNSGNSEILVFLDGFLVAGENLRVYGFDKIKSNMGVKTKEKEILNINFKNIYYTMVLTNESGGYDKISGVLPTSKNIDFVLDVSYSDADVDKNIAMDIKVENDTDKKINVNITDNQGRISIYDRNGNIVKNKSKKENLYIL